MMIVVLTTVELTTVEQLRMIADSRPHDLFSGMKGGGRDGMRTCTLHVRLIMSMLKGYPDVLNCP